MERYRTNIVMEKTKNRIVTIGGRFIISELNDSQKKMIHDPIIRKVFVFCAFFMATRDIYCAIILTIIFDLLLT